MLGSQILEVAFGLAFVFLLVSILCSGIREGIEGWLKTRAAYLEHGIRTLLNDAAGKGVANALYNHPLISGLYTGVYTPGKGTNRPAVFAKGGDLPSYIPAKNFATALMDIAARGPDGGIVSGESDGAAILPLQRIRDNVKTIQNPAVEKAILAAIDDAQGSMEKAHANIAAWFDSSMDRVSGWYKRSTQWIIFGIGMFIAVALNVNALHIAQQLYGDDALRAAAIKRGEVIASNGSTLHVKTAREELETTLPVGWGVAPGFPTFPGEGSPASAWADWTAKLFILLVGWLIVGVSATMGAPFWFDVLNKIMVIRSTVKPHEKSPEEASEDRQTAAATGPGGGSAPAAGMISGPALEVIGPADTENEVDGCDVDILDETPDERLPASVGGVA